MIRANSSRKEFDINAIMLQLSIDALRFIMRALQDPLNPGECGDSLYGAIIRLAPLEGVQKTKEGPGLFNAAQTLWTTLYRFILTPRTDEQLEAMFKKLSVCSCKYQSGVGLSGTFHDQCHTVEERRNLWTRKTGRPMPAVEFEYSASSCIEGTYTHFFFIYIFGVLRKILHPGHGPGHISVTLIRKGQSKRWPTQLSDLMPFGVEELIKTFQQWNRILDDPCVLKFAIPIFTTCGALVQQRVAELNLTNDMVFEPSKRYLDANLKVLMLGAKDIRPPSPWKEMIWRICDFCSYISWVQSPGIVTPDWFYHGKEVEALQLCTLFCYLLEFVTEQQCHNPEVSFTQELSVKAADLGQSILDRVCVDGEEHLDIILHPLITTCHTHRSQRGHSEEEKRRGNIVSYAMIKSRVQHRCASFGCRNTLLHVGSGFKLCQGCSTVGYCGSECRARDWRDSEFPHKASCPIMARILKKLGGWPNFRERDESDLNATSPEIQTHVTLVDVIEDMINDGTFPEDELHFMRMWSLRLVKSWSPVPPAEIAASKRSTGYDNYAEILATITGRRGFRGPHPIHLNPKEACT